MDRLISEQEIINILMDNDLDHIQIKDGTELIQLVQAIPSAEPKTGHWVKGKCDQCGGHAPFWSMATTYYESEYCPKCGAKMVEPQERSEE